MVFLHLFLFAYIFKTKYRNLISFSKFLFHFLQLKLSKLTSFLEFLFSISSFWQTFASKRECLSKSSKLETGKGEVDIHIRSMYMHNKNNV
jgi:uncharacterized membrane protein (UPF0182 family)